MFTRLPIAVCVLFLGCDPVVDRRNDEPPAAEPPAAEPPPAAVSSAKPTPAPELSEDWPPLLEGHYRVTKVTERDGTTTFPNHRETSARIDEVSYVGMSFEDDWLQLRLQCLLEGDFDGPDASRRYFTFESAAASTTLRWTQQGPVLKAALNLVADTTIIERVATHGDEWKIDWVDDGKQCSMGLPEGALRLTKEGYADGRPIKAWLEDSRGTVWQLEAVEGWLSNEDIHYRIDGVIGQP